MALGRVHTWNSGDILTASDLNGEFNNILNNSASLISPLTGTLDVNNKQLMNLVLEKLAAAATPATQARLYYRTDNNLPEYDTGSATRSIANLVWPGGRLTKSGANLLFSPYAHNLLPVNGRLELIPDAGVTLGVGGLSANTSYNIYAFMTGATLTLEASATAVAIQAGTGVQIKSGDATRTWLGTGQTDGATAWITPQTTWSPFQIYGDTFTGLSTSAPGGATTLTITAGATSSDDALVTDKVLMPLAAYTKTTATWAVGTGNGGLDTGAIAANTWYHVFVIQRPVLGFTDVLFSLSPSAPTMPANYTKKRRIGSFKTDATPNIIGYTQDGDSFLWLATVLDINDGAPGTAAVTRTLTVPTGVKVEAMVNFAVATAGGAQSVILSSLDQNDEAPSLTAAPLAMSGVSLTAGAIVDQRSGSHRVRTNTSAQIRSRQTTSAQLYIATIGWLDRRGRG